jgi:hypothetical protein
MTHAANPFAAVEFTSTAQNRAQRSAIIGAIKTFAETPAPISAEQIRDLFAFENRLYPVIQRDKLWFFENVRAIEGLQFARDLAVLHSFAAKMLEQLVARRGEWSHGDSDPLLQQVVGFALFHHVAAVKWCFFRHEPVKPTVWPDLHSLFRFAESQGFAATPFPLFEAENAFKVTPQALYLRALFLDVLNTGSLTTAQLEVADGWLAEWTLDYTLDHEYSPRTHALFVDLDAMSGMQVATGLPAQPSHRFVRVDGIKDQILSVRTVLRAGRPYVGRSSTDIFPIEDHVSLLATIERLYQTLLHASASRIEERTPVEGLSADVRLGFEESHRALTGTGHAAPAAMSLASLDLSLESDAVAAAAEPAAASSDARWTRWKIHDMSGKGMGLMVDRVTGERIGVGQLLALRPDGFDHWMLGVIVRKLAQRAQGETLIGVELLSYRPVALTLKRYANAMDAAPDSGAPPVPALYLPGRDNDGKSDVLALPAGDFGLKNVFALATGQAHFRVRINRVLRKGGDWVGLRFEVIGKI